MTRWLPGLALLLAGCSSDPLPAAWHGAVFSLSAARPGPPSQTTKASGLPAVAASPGAPAAAVPGSQVASAPPVVVLGGSSGGGSGGGGNGGGVVAPAGPFHGVVRVALADGEGAAIAGARVQAADGVVTTDADGKFEVGATGSLVVSADGYATSVVSGWDGSDLTLHLATALVPLTAGSLQVAVEGTVQDADGNLVPGAVVLGGDAHGASVGPLVTDGQGHFAGVADGVLDPAGDRLTLWATTSVNGAPTRLGMARVDAGATAPAMIALAEATGTVAMTPSAPTGTVSVAVEAHGPDGESVTLRHWSDGPFLAPVFALPDVTIEARVDVSDGDASSHWHGALSAAPALLPYPAAPSGYPGPRLSWPAVAGASGYRVALRDRGAPVALWEGYAPAPGIALSGFGGTAEELVLTAIAGDDGALRSVAGLRQLRLPGSPASWSQRVVPL